MNFTKSRQLSTLLLSLSAALATAEASTATIYDLTSTDAYGNTWEFMFRGYPYKQHINGVNPISLTFNNLAQPILVDFTSGEGSDQDFIIITPDYYKGDFFVDYVSNTVIENNEQIGVSLGIEFDYNRPYWTAFYAISRYDLITHDSYREMFLLKLNPLDDKLSSSEHSVRSGTNTESNIMYGDTAWSITPVPTPIPSALIQFGIGLVGISMLRLCKS